MRPTIKTLAIAACITALTTSSAIAGEKRVEYRYPDNPNVAYSNDGMVRNVSGNQPIAFSAFEAAISTREARAVLNDGGFSDTEFPQRVTQTKTEPASMFEARSLEPAANTFVSQPLVLDPAFVIQAGAFGSYQNAERLSKRLSGFGQTSISSSNKNGKTIHRVHLGGWSQKNDAQSTLQMIKANGFEGFVTRAS